MSSQKPLSWQEVTADADEATFAFIDDDWMIPVQVDHDGVPHKHHSTGGWGPDASASD